MGNDKYPVVKYKVRSNLHPGTVLTAGELTIVNGRVLFICPVTLEHYDIPYDSCSLQTVGADAGDPLHTYGVNQTPAAPIMSQLGRYLIRCMGDPNLYETEFWSFYPDENRIRFITTWTGRHVNLPYALCSIVDRGE